MSRPKDKRELEAQSQEYFERLLELVDTLEKDEPGFEFPTGMMNRNTRDVLYHLGAWHRMMADWYKTGMAGGKPEMPAPGYTWKTTPDLNRAIWEEGQKLDLANTRKKLRETHREMMALIQKHSDEELFTKKKYDWTGSTSLGAYFISATASHYDWAFKLIKKARRQRQKK